MDSVTIRYRNNEKEFGKAMRVYYNRTLKTWFDLALALISIIVGFVLWFKLGYSYAWWFLIGAGIFGLIIILLVNFLVPMIRFRQEPKYKDEYVLMFSEDGIDFKTDHLNSKVDWSYYTKVWETTDFYFLIYGKNLFTLIPNRGFDDKAQEEAFCKLIEKRELEVVKL